MKQTIQKKEIEFFAIIFLIVLILVLMLTYQFIQYEKHEDTNNVMIYTISVVIVSIITIIVCSIIHFSENITEEKVFLYSIPVIFVMFLIAMPIFKGHDEGIHWKKAYEVSTGQLLYSTELTKEMPENIIKDVDGKWFLINYHALPKLMNIKLEPEKTVQITRGCTNYPSIQYLPQAIGIIIGRLITDRVIVMAYLGRLLNCIVSLILFYQALKRMPFAKKSMLCLLYIPILIEGCTSLSGDSLLISFAFFFIAYILNCIFSEQHTKLSIKDKTILAISALLLSTFKLVYLPCVFLVLLIPKDKFKSKKENDLYKMGIVIIGIMITLAIFLFSMRIPENRTGNNSTEQLKKIISNPLQYATVLLQSVNQQGTYYLESLFGEVLSWNEDIHLHSLVPYGLCFLTILSALLDNDIKKKLNKKQKYIIGLIILVSVILIFTSLYIGWTKTDSNIIQGVQGRYFLPLMPLILILLGSIPIHSEIDDKKLIRTIGIMGSIVQLYVITTIVITQL